MDDIRPFKSRLESEVLEPSGHPSRTPTPPGSSTANSSAAQARAFLIQFSVFSNQFLVSAAAEGPECRDARGNARVERDPRERDRRRFSRRARCGRAELGGTEGSIEGGTFHFRAAHFELLVRMARQFGLEFAEPRQAPLRRRPRRCHSATSCCASTRTRTTQVAAAASWAVENWAAAGFWDELVKGGSATPSATA